MVSVTVETTGRCWLALKLRCGCHLRRLPVASLGLTVRLSGREMPHVEWLAALGSSISLSPMRDCPSWLTVGPNTHCKQNLWALAVWIRWRSGRQYDWRLLRHHHEDIGALRGMLERLRPLEARSLSHHPPLGAYKVTSPTEFVQIVGERTNAQVSGFQTPLRLKTGMPSSSWPPSRPAMAAMCLM